jgi:WD40 repeat protein
LTGHNSAVSCVTFASNCKTIASGSYDKTIRLWDTSTGKQIGEPLEGHSERVLSVKFNIDDKIIVSGGADSTIRLWDVQTKK